MSLTTRFLAVVFLITLRVVVVGNESLAGPAQQSNDKEARKTVPAGDTQTWIVKSLKQSDIQGLRGYAPDGKRFLINKEDEKGVAQVYIGEDGKSQLTCITNTQRPGGPKPDRFKMQPAWHPSGKWIFMAVERDQYSPPPFADRKVIEGMLQCGLWTNMYVVSTDGKQWHRLSDFKSGVPGVPDGFTGPALTHDGKKAVWSQIVDGNIFAYYPFGRWELILADVEMHDGAPRYANLKDITPKGMHWNEPGNFHPDNESLLLTGSVDKDAQGMDQYILNIKSGKLTNLTNSPTVWDEHGLFSPDGEKIIFMSAYPFRADPNSSKILSIKTEFMLMNKDGTGLTQLTHFYSKESQKRKNGGMAACPAWNPDGRSAQLSRLFFPKYEYWNIEFQTNEKATDENKDAKKP
jgi:Tol biopolymer transport system component